MRNAMDQQKIIIMAGEECRHCGDRTPLGGICPDCGGKICTRSLRVRNMALERGINPYWACPIVNPSHGQPEPANP